MSDKTWLSDVELQGELVSLKPLQHSHAPALLQAAADGELWNLWYTDVPDENSLENYIEFALAERSAGRSLAFVVIDNASQKIIGSTRYCNADVLHQRLEIGYTWYSKSYQRSGVNTECKYLLLCHAFEVLSAIAVEFRTHWFNHASRQAISRLGAKQDGVLRNHKRLPDGSYRDTLVFSIINHEWSAVKQHLQFKQSGGCYELC